MRHVDPRWVLAFDGSCANCRKISGAVAQACDGKLGVMPLSDGRVREWREQAFGSNAPWAPALLRVDGATVRGWSGAAMTAPLLRRLGPRSTARVLRALGELRRQDALHTGRGSGVLGRAQFLRLGMGLAVAAGVMFKGAAPAFAENEVAGAHAWVQAHRGSLPTGYDEVVSYPVSYRRAIHEALPPESRSRLWVEHLRRYSESRPRLTSRQRSVVRRAQAVAGDAATFEGEPPTELLDVSRAVREEFSPEDARAMLGVLGSPAAAVPPPNCECNLVDVYCDWGGDCRSGGCATTSAGCGSLYVYPCNGLCYD